MKKIGICGHFNNGSEPIGGQTIKTRIITEELEKKYGEENILKLDTEEWRKNKFIFFLKCIMFVLNIENIIILPAHNGVKLLLPIFVLFKKIFKKKLHYIIVGAWLPDLLSNNKYLIWFCKNTDYMYAQTNILIERLAALDIKTNTYYLPNFKNIQPIKLLNKNTGENNIFYLCMVSRINYQKGVESAIEVVSKINQNSNKYVVKLDIYGPIETSYESHFKELIKKYKDYIEYKGIINHNNTVDVIKNYYLLLFPTKYYTEGLPGTILDSYLSGVPVLASRWESWSDIIKHGITGMTYEFNNNNEFYKSLIYLLSNSNLVNKMKKNCLVEVKKYTAENTLKILYRNIS